MPMCQLLYIHHLWATDNQLITKPFTNDLHKSLMKHIGVCKLCCGLLRGEFGMHPILITPSLHSHAFPHDTKNARVALIQHILILALVPLLCTSQKYPDE